MTKNTTVRIAHPTDDLDAVVRFYVVGLGLTFLGSFEDHEGFDGVMVGVPGAPFHLEFTRKRGHPAGPAPAEDDLLVFYVPDRDLWQVSVDGMQAAGYRAVPPSNPYWNRRGLTFQDPDGYRVVLENCEWPL